MTEEKANYTTNVNLTSEELKLLQKMREFEEQDRKGQEKNPPFVQIYKGVGFRALQWLTVKHSTASSIMMFFMNEMNNNNVIMISQNVLAEILGKGRTTIYNGIKFLDKHNFIEIAKIGQANAYIVNPEIAFQDAHQKKKYTNFQGSIVLGESENEELFKKHSYMNLKLMDDEKASKPNKEFDYED